LGYFDTEGLKVSYDRYQNPENRNSLFPEPDTTNNPKVSAPQLVSQEDFTEAKRVLDRNQEIVNGIRNKYDV